MEDLQKLSKEELIQIEKITNGRYELGLSGRLFFDIDNCEGMLKIDKESALEIMHTLLDSMNMLDKNMEELICNIAERIDGNVSD